MNIYNLINEKNFLENFTYKDSRTLSDGTAILSYFDEEISSEQKYFLILLNKILIKNEKIKEFFLRGSSIWVFDYINFYQPIVINHFVNFIELNRKIVN